MKEIHNKITENRSMIKSLLMSLVLLTAVGCTKAKSTSSALSTATPQTDSSFSSEQPDDPASPAVAPVAGINPTLKMYGNSVLDATGLLGFGGQLLNVNIDALTQDFDIGLKLPTPLMFLAQTFLLKYPEINTSIIYDATGAAVLHLKVPIASVMAAYKKWKAKQDANVSNPVVQPVLPVVTNPVQGPTAPTTPVVTNPKSIKGHYSGQIDPPPREVRLANRDARLIEQGYTPTGTDADNALTGGGGLDGGIYLAGAFQFDVDANGNITTGEFTIHGYSFPVSSGHMGADGSFTIDASQVPVRGRWNGTSFDYTPTFATDSARGSKVLEPGREHVYGDMVGTFTPVP